MRNLAVCTLCAMLVSCGDQDVAGGSCGNGIIDAGEVCDGHVLGGTTCVTASYSFGSISCAPDCRGFDLSGCSDTPIPVPLPTVELAWTTCSLISGGSDSDAECATVQLPAHYDVPGSPTIEIAVKRRLASSTSNGQMWLLNGGPGGSGTAFERVLGSFVPRDDLDAYMMEHRGVGLSTRLSCPVEEDPGSDGGFAVTLDELPGCLTHLQAQHDLSSFDTTGAAYDLATLIEATREPADEVFVYGVSYGTYWLHRYAQIAPNQPTGLVFDSICAPGQCILSEYYDLAFDQVGRALLDLCTTYPECSTKLPDPTGTLSALLDLVDAGHCSALSLTRDSVRTLLGAATRSITHRSFVPALIYRLTRCAAGDVAALTQYVDVLFPASSPLTQYGSSMLGNNIVISELWRELEPSEEAAIDDALFIAGLYAGRKPIAEIWPAYEPDPFYFALADTDAAVLMMQGTLDPQTPPAVSTVLEELFTREHQSYVLVPYAAHNIVQQSPKYTGGTCGGALMQQFVTDPMTTLDTSCTSETYAPSLAPAPATVEWAFGTTALWDS